MTEKHTQGEWWKYQSDSNISILASKDKKDTHIAQIDNNTKEDIANAKLIASAPELLRALDYLLRNFDSEKNCAQAIIRANEAIKQARS